MYTHIHMYVYLYIYIYIFMYRERERCIYTYIYILGVMFGSASIFAIQIRTLLAVAGRPSAFRTTLAIPAALRPLLRVCFYPSQRKRSQLATRLHAPGSLKLGSSGGGGPWAVGASGSGAVRRAGRADARRPAALRRGRRPEAGASEGAFRSAPAKRVLAPKGTYSFSRRQF